MNAAAAIRQTIHYHRFSIHRHDHEAAALLIVARG